MALNSGMMRSAGTSACDKTLHRLLDRAERAVFSGDGALSSGPTSLASFPVTTSSTPEYFGLPSFDDRLAYHARARNLENTKAITLEWDRQAGEGGQLSRISVRDTLQLYRALGRHPAWSVAHDAIERLLPHVQRVPGAKSFIAAWSKGRKLRSKSPEDIEDVLAGCEVLVWLQDHAPATGDASVRRVSAQLFRDTKRIERLTAVLDELTGGDDLAGGADDILARLGLVKHPQPLLIAGALEITIKGTTRPCDLPYSGVAPDALVGARPCGSLTGVLLSVENLATFNELARDPRRPPDLALLYTGGMPTPAFLRAYSRLLATLPGSWVLVHWGDIDQGGFRIANHLRKTTVEQGRDLKPWNMDLSRIANARSIARHAMDSHELKNVRALCESLGWEREANAFRNEVGLAVEQEGIGYDWTTLPRSA
jgi:hypothetical protein